MTYQGPDASKSKVGFDSRWPDLQVHTLHCPHHRPASPVLWSVMRTVQWNSRKTLLSLAFLLSSVIACPAQEYWAWWICWTWEPQQGYAGWWRLMFKLTCALKFEFGEKQRRRRELLANSTQWKACCGASDCHPVAERHGGVCPSSGCGLGLTCWWRLPLPRRGEQGDSSTEVGWAEHWKIEKQNKMPNP